MTRTEQQKNDRKVAKASRGKSSRLRKGGEGGVAVWAVDPFDPDQERIRSMSDLLKAWAPTLLLRVQPISIVGPMDLNWPIEFKASFHKNVSKLAEKSISPLFDDIARDPVFDEPKVLVQPTTSLTASVDFLLNEAKKQRAQFIAVSTHGRKGFERFRLGSFAESIIAYSKVPVLALGPKMKAAKNISRILVATDFSSSSRRVYVRVIEWAKKLGAQIVLLHRFENPVPAILYGGTGAGVDAELIAQMLHDAKVAREKQAHAWQKLAQGQGVECSVVFSRDLEGLGEAIASHAKKERVDLIAMTTYRGPIGQGLLGSVARDVLALAPCPVLISHR